MALYLNISRSYATAASGKMVRAPVAFFGIDGKYTNALYSAAVKTKKSDKVEEDLKNLRDLYRKDTRFRDFLGDPLIKSQVKMQALDGVAGKVKLCDITVNLVKLLAENNRLKLLPQVADNFSKIMSNIRGEMDCVITTAKPIDNAAVRKELEDAIKKFTTKKLTISTKVDPSLVGGMIIDFGGEYYIDMSLRNKMKMYTDILKETL